MSLVRRYTFTVVVATVALVVLLGLQPFEVETIVAGYAIALAGIALAALATAMREAQRRPGSRFERELTRRREPPSRPTELVRLEREITLAVSNAAHAHERLRPLLQGIAEARLGRRFGRDELGDDAWAFLRPDAPAPEDRTARGLPLRRIRALIEALERA